jgi:hypothetical protein
MQVRARSRPTRHLSTRVIERRRHASCPLASLGLGALEGYILRPRHRSILTVLEAWPSGLTSQKSVFKVGDFQASVEEP